MKLSDLKQWAQEVIKLQERAYDWAGVPYNENYYRAEFILGFISNYENLLKKLDWIESLLNIDIDKEMKND